MPYTPQAWADNDSSKPVSAARMTVIENAIQSATSTAESANTVAGNALSVANTANTNANTALATVVGKGVWTNLMSARMMLSAINATGVRWPDGLGGAGLAAAGSAWSATTPPPELWHYSTSDEVSGRSFEYRFQAYMIFNTAPNITANITAVQLPQPLVAAPTATAGIPLPNLSSLLPSSPQTGAVTFANTSASGQWVTYTQGTPFSWTPTDGSLWCLICNTTFTTTNAFAHIGMRLQRRFA